MYVYIHKYTHKYIHAYHKHRVPCCRHHSPPLTHVVWHADLPWTNPHHFDVGAVHLGAFVTALVLIVVVTVVPCCGLKGDSVCVYTIT